jgi:hypothetical protein
MTIAFPTEDTTRATTAPANRLSEISNPQIPQSEISNPEISDPPAQIKPTPFPSPNAQRENENLPDNSFVPRTVNSEKEKICHTSH